MPYVAPNLDAVHPVGLVTTNQNLSCRSRLSKVHDSYTPHCATAACYTINGERRDIVYLRDSGSLETLVSKQCFSEGDYIDTSEHRLIQGIFGIPTEIPWLKSISKTINSKAKFYVVWYIPYLMGLNFWLAMIYRELCL